MSSDDIELAVSSLITDLLTVLYDHGIREVHMGGLLRLLGVSDDIASLQDNELVVLDERFAKYITQINQLTRVDQADQIVH
jgi:hypothetical protein